MKLTAHSISLIYLCWLISVKCCRHQGEMSRTAKPSYRKTKIKKVSVQQSKYFITP